MKRMSMATLKRNLTFPFSMASKSTTPTTDQVVRLMVNTFTREYIESGTISRQYSEAIRTLQDLERIIHNAESVVRWNGDEALQTKYGSQTK